MLTGSNAPAAYDATLAGHGAYLAPADAKGQAPPASTPPARSILLLDAVAACGCTETEHVMVHTPLHHSIMRHCCFQTRDSSAELHWGCSQAGTSVHDRRQQKHGVHHLSQIVWNSTALRSCAIGVMLSDGGTGCSLLAHTVSYPVHP